MLNNKNLKQNYNVHALGVMPFTLPYTGIYVQITIYLLYMPVSEILGICQTASTIRF